MTTGKNIAEATDSMTLNYLDDKQFETGNLTLFYGYVSVILFYHRFLSLWSLNLSELV